MSQIHQAAQRRLATVSPPVQGIRSVRSFPTAETEEMPGGPRQARDLNRAREGFQQLAESIRGSWPGENLLALGLTSRVLLVVSAVHGEGTSTVARNLAARLADGGGSSVVLVDANLQTPSQHLSLDVPRPWGLAEVIRGRVSLDRALYVGSQSTPSFLSSGSEVPAPACLLATREAQKTFRDLGSRFHWVIVDGPPVTVCSEAATLARLADAALLVVKAEATRHEVAKQAGRALGDCGTRIVGAVLNHRRYHLPEWVYGRLR